MLKQKGFTLISVLISILILTLVTLALYNLFDFSLKIIGENKARVTAISLANQRMEMVRNLPYIDIGTEGGIPPGSIPQSEDFNISGKIFSVNTQVIYIDDPFDGLAGGDPVDPLPTDYKRVKVTASWFSRFGKTESVVLLTDASSKGYESTSNSGTLIIEVFDANGFPVPTSSVTIINNQVIPSINIETQTDNNGVLIYPGAPVAQESYEITVTKEGYSTDYTSAVTPQNPNPTKPHASIFEGLVTEISFAIDRVSIFNIEAIEQAVSTEWVISNDITEEVQDYPSVSVDAFDNYYFIWHDQRTGQERIFAQKYDSNKNQQWSSDLQIVTSNNQIFPRISTDIDGYSYMTWQDDRNGNQDIYLQKFDNSGNAVWVGEKKVNVDASSADQNLPVVSANTSTAYIVWQDDRSGNLDIYAQRYSPAGVQLWVNDLKINTDTGSGNQSYPAVALDSENNFYVIWQDDRNGDNDIYAQKYDQDANKLWVADKKINTDVSLTNQDYPVFTLDDVNDFLYIAWQDERNGGSSGNVDIYAQKYDASGNEIWTEDIRMNTDLTSAYQSYPSIAYEGNNKFYITWQDNRNGNNDVYAQKCDQNGGSLWAEDVKINTNYDNSDQRSPRVVVDNAGYGIFTWYDNRNGNYDIYAAKFLEPGTQNYLPNIPLQVTGSKTIGNDPIIYKYNQQHSTDGSGLLTLNNLEWDSYTIVPTTTVYFLTDSIPGQPINLLPNTTTPITLILSDEL